MVNWPPKPVLDEDRFDLTLLPWMEEAERRIDDGSGRTPSATTFNPDGTMTSESETGPTVTTTFLADRIRAEYGPPVDEVWDTIFDGNQIRREQVS